MEKLLIGNQNIVKYFNIFQNLEFRFRPDIFFSSGRILKFWFRCIPNNNNNNNNNDDNINDNNNDNSNDNKKEKRAHYSLQQKYYYFPIPCMRT